MDDFIRWYREFDGLVNLFFGGGLVALYDRVILPWKQRRAERRKAEQLVQFADSTGGDRERISVSVRNRTDHQVAISYLDFPKAPSRLHWAQPIWLEPNASTVLWLARVKKEDVLALPVDQRKMVLGVESPDLGSFTVPGYLKDHADPLAFRITTSA